MKYLLKMWKMPRLRQNEKEQAVGMLRAGMAQTQIANHSNVNCRYTDLIKKMLSLDKHKMKNEKQKPKKL
jgi:hypothetical protein